MDRILDGIYRIYRIYAMVRLSGWKRFSILLIW